MRMVGIPKNFSLNLPNNEAHHSRFWSDGLRKRNRSSVSCSGSDGRGRKTWLRLDPASPKSGNFAIFLKLLARATWITRLYLLKNAFIGHNLVWITWNHHHNLRFFWGGFRFQPQPASPERLSAPFSAPFSAFLKFLLSAISEESMPMFPAIPGMGGLVGLVEGAAKKSCTR